MVALLKIGIARTGNVLFVDHQVKSIDGYSDQSDILKVILAPRGSGLQGVKLKSDTSGKRGLPLHYF